MKITAKKIYFAVFFLLLFGNILSLFIFSDYLNVSGFSIFPASVMLFSIVCAIFAYDFRHSECGKPLSFTIYNEPLNMAKLIPKLLKDEDFAFSPEYQNEFALTLFVYCAAIPFHIPVIFFSTYDFTFLSSIVIFVIPQLIFIIRGAIFVAKTFEVEKQYDRERIEQEKREELGKWKK